jgi:polyhydroxyalkanoate synthesis repressor PhaR
LLDQTVENKSAKPAPVRIIKRYANRKLYDTQHSAYVTLYDILKMVRANQEIMVLDNKSNADITKTTLTQIIFDIEKQEANFAPLQTLRDIIKHSNGSLSHYLAKLGAIPEDYFEKEAAAVAQNPALSDYLKQSLGQKITAAKAFPDFKPAAETIITTSSEISKAAASTKSEEASILLPGSSIV